MPAVHPVVEGPPQSKGMFLPLSPGSISAASALEYWIGLCLESIKECAKPQ